MQIEFAAMAIISHDLLVFKFCQMIQKGVLLDCLREIYDLTKILENVQPTALVGKRARAGESPWSIKGVYLVKK